MAKRPPWKKANPRKKAGRRYPSLVDNMNAAKAKKRKR